MRTRHRVLTLLTPLALASACQSAAPAPTPSPVLEPPKEVAARVYFDKAAAWLPEDVIAISVIDTRRFKRAFTMVDWRTSDPKLRQSLSERQAKLLRDVSALFRARVGVDPFDADHIVMGFHKQGIEILFYGLKPAPKATQKVEGERKLIRLFPNAEPDKALAGGQELWAQMTPDGIAFHVPFKGGPPGVPRHSTRLQGTERAALFTKVLETSPSTFAIAAVFDDPQLKQVASARAGVPAPRAARISLEKDLTMLIEGPPETLAKAQELLDTGLRALDAELEALLDERPAQQLSTPELLGRFQAASFRKILAAGLRSETVGETWRVSVPTLGSGPMLAFSTTGILAAIAIPAFMRSVKKSKTAESVSNLRKISDAAKAYYETERLDAKGKPLPCAFPPSAPMTGPLPKAGVKVLPTSVDPKIWGMYGVDFSNPMYFAYEIVSNGQTGASATLKARAHADFDASSSRHHIAETFVQGQGRVNGTCEAQIMGSFILNEFE